MSLISYTRPSILDRVPRDNHGVIEADAGAGKTHTIEHLVVDLLLSTACTVEEILVVTFTEKATVELRSRIRSLLEQIASGTAPRDESAGEELRDVDQVGRRKLEAALFSFDRASIFTIHGFCRRVLTELAFDSGVRFQLEVVDSRAAFHRAFRAELRESLAVEESFRALLAQWLGRDDAAARENLTSALEQLLFEARFHRYQESGAPRENQRAIAQLAERFDLAMLKGAYDSVRNPRRDRARTAAADELATLIAKAGRDPGAVRKALSGFDFEPLPDAAWVSERSNALPAATARLLGIIDACRRAMSLEVRVVDSFLPRVAERIDREKGEAGTIDYDDMLAWVWRAIGGPRGDALVSALRARFRYALVDEFQDTDELQWKIFRRIFVEGEPASFLQVVGDPKQAIYGFRGADVFSYLHARKELTDRGVKPVPLSRNFRSTAGVIDACNLIFDQQAVRPIFSGAIRYDQPAECGRPDLRAIDRRGNPIRPVTLFRYAPVYGPGSATRMRATIGRCIASTLHRILFDEQHRIAIEGDDKNGDQKNRRVEPNDALILTRTGAESVEIGRYLRERGVPYAFYKQGGLFQTTEAYDVLDVLKAIDEPNDRSRRLKAWASPFFSVPFDQLYRIGELPPGHRLGESLLEWNALAGEGRLVELFDLLLHKTGLVDRELFGSDSERELTNYQHIFEILLQDALTERLSIREVISKLESYAAGTTVPSGANGNIQRMVSERRAVRIMTVHMSKGLEADAVFLFGGTAQGPDKSKVWVYHEGYERRLAVGGTAKQLAKDRLDEEGEEENQRLIYVALTRARVKLYLPFFPEGSAKRLNGYYRPLNDRLSDLLADPGNAARARLFEIEDARDPDHDSAPATEDLPRRLMTWSPPQSLLRDDRDDKPARFFDDLRDRHAALVTASYTALDRSRPARPEIEPEDFKYDLEAATETADLPGGRHVGIFLHEVIEKLDLRLLANSVDLASWKGREDLKTLVVDTMRRHQVRDPRWADRGAEVVFNALRSPIELRGGVSIGPLCRCPSVREMEFVYPIPEAAHPLLASGREGAWTVERGYLKGFVDFVFEHDGMTYFADWKSDLLPSYEHAAIEAHVKQHYEIQAKIYSVGIVRLLRIGNEDQYEERFGGLLYLFIRGMKADAERGGSDGVYFRRPRWQEIVSYEADLIDVTRRPGSIP